ncbi:MAG: (d)CMP kinase [Acidobacteria bacterium]|nr:(d)CMP kinase [Acidobacteriota bacterium]
MKSLIIAIDGPVGSGKSSAARRVAELLGYTYLDSGAMYRALALKAIRQKIPVDDVARLEKLAAETHIDLLAGENGQHVILDGADVTAEIRSPNVSQTTSKMAVLAGVRKQLVTEQRRAGAAGGVVMEGRDIGTVVFPDADLKIYLDASVEVRAQRRLHEHIAQGENISLETMMEEVHQRDVRDKEREVSPLTRAVDAVLVDNTAMDVEETARLIVLLAQQGTLEEK